MGTRRQPLLFEITTAGINRQGPWWAHREYTRMILEGLHQDDAWFGFIAGADAEDDWTLPETWARANPNYNISVKPDFLETECRKAQAMPVFQSAFRRLHVGQLVEQEEKVIDRAHWDACADPTLRVEAFADRPCYAGLDLSSTTDLTALVLLFVEDAGRFVVFPTFWIPGDNIARRVQRDHVPYDVWVRDGAVVATEGNITDYNVVERDILAQVSRLDLQVLAYDPSNATQLATRLGEALGPDKLLAIPQGFKHYNDPTRRLIALVDGAGLAHPAHPVLTWNADNLTVTTNSYGEIRPDKSKAIERIDGMVALLLALGRAITTPEPTVSVYETRGVLTL
jgi:phage terminase large subunit-like protein